MMRWDFLGRARGSSRCQGSGGNIDGEVEFAAQYFEDNDGVGDEESF